MLHIRNVNAKYIFYQNHESKNKANVLQVKNSSIKSARGKHVRSHCVICVASLNLKLGSRMKTATKSNAPKVIFPFHSDYCLFPIQTKAALLRP